ncbi:hypothetical protein [Thermomonospora umbrina]|uniref:Uncharacterized protein n=1 Tax=Thermomonospora umbrina TaxID=111806 RepID=A0A3D9SJM5_9ACTN|nr:hypothetical protein [Thermomonospora umbrina]REE96089.1 hypothetical protein DFJ69_1513 [Thermomonospora umbrina]
MSVALLLAEPGKDFELNDDTVTPGLIGFAVFVGLCVAVFFLARSMNKRIKNIDLPREADLRQRDWERVRADSEPADPEPVDETAPAEDAPEEKVPRE